MNPNQRSSTRDGSRYHEQWILVLGTLGFALAIIGPATALAADCNRNGIADLLDPDTDGDGVPNACDNCRLTVNVSQTDSDEDGTGDRCDADLDNNGIVGLADYNVLRTCLASPEARCDLDEDGTVGASDVSVLGSFFGGPKERGRQPTQLMRGYIQTTPVDNGGAPVSARIYLPNVEVYLQNLATGVDSYSVRTDLSGRFSLYAFVDGDYRVCWRAEGFLPGCFSRLDDFGNSVNAAQIGNIEIFEDTDDPNPTMFGHVSLTDGSDPRILLPAIGLNQVAEVAVLGSDGNALSRVYVNNYGNYYLPSVPTSGPSDLAVFLGEDQISSLQVYPTAGVGFLQSHKKDLVIANRAPRVKTITARINGARARVAAPGSVVSLGTAVDDPNGDPLTYEWWVGGNAGTLSAATSATTNWQLPNAEGFYTVHVLARDANGGHDQSTLNLRVTNSGIIFSGRVTDPGGTGVSGANIEINGTSVTSADGSFHVDVPDSDRFVFNIRAAGYGLLSQIFDDGVTGGSWTLYPAEVFSVDPSAAIQITHQRGVENCPGPRSLRQNYATFPGIEEPVWQDGMGNVVAAFDTPPTALPGPGGSTERDCPPGISLSIPANSLVDADGNLPSGLVEITLSTVDLFSPQQMPGDYTVEASDGTTSMRSYGAGGISIQAGGTPYNLNGSVSAEVRIPVDPSQLAAGGPFPPTIPALYYDESQGVWRQEGNATLVGTDYVYMASHFSSINMDVLKEGQACVRIFSEPPFPANYDLEVQVPNGTAAPVIVTQEIDNTSPYVHVVYNLPIDTNIVLVPIRTDGRLGVDPAPLGTFIVNTGPAQNPENPNLPNYGSEGAPYPACSTQVDFHDSALPEEEEEFLHGLLTFAASRTTEPGPLEPGQEQVGPATPLKEELNAATAAYYEQIDPRGKRLTLTDFYNENDFGEPGGTEANTTFANAGDLGFGREMHCRRNGDDVACYVTNYGFIHTPDSEDLVAANAQDGPIATVAMEYSRIESQPGQSVEFDDPERVVKFYVYEKGYDLTCAPPCDPTNPGPGGLLVEADLDNRGDRPIPQLCQVCHGGHYPSGPVRAGALPYAEREDVKLGSQFVPFDLSLYEFLDDADEAAQQSEFKVMNEMVSHVASKLVDDPPVISNPEIVAVISEMYSGVDPNVQEEGFVVPLWNGAALQEQMYTDVLAPSCRTCHLAHSAATSGFPGLRFGSHADFVSRLGTAESVVCSQFVMPHAKVTHELFWTSLDPHQPGVFTLYGDAFPGPGWSGTLCLDFTPAGDAVITDYQTDIQSIYTSRCGSCHSDGTDYSYLPIRLDTADNSYATTVGINSTQEPGLKLVELVEPINPAAISYLFQKITDTHGNATEQMPWFQDPLSPSEITTIEEWINNGASAN
jgi:mono/diheme cytochrome c family protein